MGELINPNFNNNEQNKQEKINLSENKPADIIDFKKHKEKREEETRDREEVENIIKRSNRNQDGTYAVKLDLVLENSKRNALKEHLMLKGLHFYSIDKEMGSNESKIGFDLDISKDQLPGLLKFLKEENVEYAPFE